MSGWNWFVTKGFESIVDPDVPTDPNATTDILKERIAEATARELDGGIGAKFRYWSEEIGDWVYRRHEATRYDSEAAADKVAFGMATNNPNAIGKVGTERMWYETPEIRFDSCPLVSPSPGSFRRNKGSRRASFEMVSSGLPVAPRAIPLNPFRSGGGGMEDFVTQAELEGEPDGPFDLPTIGQADDEEKVPSGPGEGYVLGGQVPSFKLPEGEGDGERDDSTLI